jgi:two-component system OmpR family sensor kinase
MNKPKRGESASSSNADHAKSTGLSNVKDSLHRWSEHIRRPMMRQLDAVPLSTKLVACTLVVLVMGTLGITFAIRYLVGGYLLDKTDQQLTRQASLIFNNIRQLSQEDNGKGGVGPTDYYLQIRDANYQIMTTALTPTLSSGVTSSPVLPASGSMGSIQIGQPFTTTATVNVSADHNQSDSATLKMANAPWRVVALEWQIQGQSSDQDSSHGVLFIGLSLSDQLDTTETLTRYSLFVGIGIVLLGALLAMLTIQRTLLPLKRIEKTAAQIAAGDLSQRIPPAPDNTEVGSLSTSLNAMLARIEQSFDEQTETTEKMKRFVSDASHELRTPLAAIHGYAELYKMQRDYPGALERADESIQHIEASSTRMAILVEDLLSLARLDEGRGIDVHQQVRLSSVVNDAVDDLHALDPSRDIAFGTLSIHGPAPEDNVTGLASLNRKASTGHPQFGMVQKESGEGPSFAFSSGTVPDVTIPGDPSRLRQVVTNIVGNIHRYTPSDSPVRVGLGVMPASISAAALSRLPSKASSLARFIEAAEVGQGNNMGTRYAVVQFSDHGPGVPEASLHQLFERFYTADPSRAREKGGTGLGLAIAFSVVKAHQGMICATQTPGGGLTFTVVLPLGVEERHEAPTATSSSDNHGGRKARQNAKAQAKAQSKAQARSKVSSPSPAQQQESASSALPSASNAGNSQRDASGGSVYDSHGDARGVPGLHEPQAQATQGDSADTGHDKTTSHGS